MISRTGMFAILFLFFTNVFAENHSEKQAVQNAYYSWCKAISEAKGNPQLVVKFYAPDATLMPTLSADILHNTDGGLNEYFTHLTSYRDIHCVPQKLTTRIKGQIATNNGLYDFVYFNDQGKQQNLPARFTFIYKKINGEWLITQHHSSKLP